MEKRHYLIVGGNSGIGLESIKRLASNGHEITVMSRNTGEWEGWSGLNHIHYEVGAAESLHLPDVLDGLVYFPGTINLKPFRSLKNEDFLKEFEVNVVGAIEVIRKAYSSLKKGHNAGIVLFSTVAVQQGMPFHAGIAAAKGAIEGLTRSLAAEFAPDIRVNAIAPSLTDTPLASALLSSAEKREASEKRHPLKRLGNPAETAGLVEFLLGKDSGFITGQVIGVDGGLSSVKLF